MLNDEQHDDDIQNADAVITESYSPGGEDIVKSTPTTEEHASYVCRLMARLNQLELQRSDLIQQQATFDSAKSKASLNTKINQVRERLESLIAL